MSDRQHTPGPWDALDRWNGRPEHVVISHAPASMGAFTFLVAGVYSDAGEADARLIAAAPDMLAALTDLITELEAYGDDEVLEPALRDARAAIAKACGEGASDGH